MRRATTAFCLLIVAFCAVAAHAQVFDLDYDREPVVAIDGLWRFHPGDDPHWADSTFDDSKWPLLHSDRDWSSQGYTGLSGFAWYRFRVVVPAGCPPLSLYVPQVFTSYEFYVDGVKIGDFGGLPPNAEPDHAIPQTFSLPRATSAAHTVTFAIRVWHWPGWAMYYGGGPHAVPLIGLTPLVQQHAADALAGHSWTLVDEIVLAILEGLAGLAALGLFYLQATENEYLWFGLMLLFSAAVRCFTIWADFHRFSVLTRDEITAVLTALGGLAAIAFYNRLLHGKRNWFFWLAAASAIAGACVQFADGFLVTVKQSQAFAAFLLLPFSAWVLTLLIRAARAGLDDARLLLLPVLLQQAANLTGELLWLSYLAGWQRKFPQADVTLSHWPFYFTLTDLAAALFLLTMLAILINRFTRTRHEEERFTAELDAARSVQHVLIPDDLPSIPGFTVGGVYKPASEVGGDFYQIIPLAELGCQAGDQTGGALVMVGDVSGKGLQAANTVSLIVGSLRTLADHTQQPAAVLAGLNRRLVERSGGGFTTCLVMLIDAAGGLTIATAGHLPPYRNGKELALDDGLPLGLTLDAAYEETRFQLAPGDKLTLISDGVLEARNLAGELFGFDRTRSLSTQNAAYIAAAAQDFGQEDDITVLTLVRQTEKAVNPIRLEEVAQ